jgi:hypothetical protein
MNIKFISEIIEGETPLEDLKLVCVADKKYKRVSLCIKSNMNITFAVIKLYYSDKFVDAEKSFEAAEALGNEIVKAFNNRIEYEDNNETRI